MVENIKACPHNGDLRTSIQKENKQDKLYELIFRDFWDSNEKKQMVKCL